VNYLQLINRARVECGVSGASTPLTEVTALTGESYRIASWVNSAWVDIQTAKEDWQWMRDTVEFTLTTQQQFYTPTEAGVGSTFANWKRDSWRASSVGQDYKDEQLLNYMDYTTFRNLYMYANMRNTYARPVVVTVDPDKRLGFGTKPDQPYVISGEYYVQPTEFSASTDAPPSVFPTRFHMMIVYRAMMFYGGYESAPEVYQRGEFEFKRLMNRLDIDQLPTLVSGPPLA
jgi:hypothetical protein|tara:strand:+ start:384 stop:1076 length:693 start_codon:yes stop_codon:yes gene_type:complete